MESTEAANETKVVVSRVVGSGVKAVWNFLMTPAGATALLGEGGQLGNKGESWKATDGTYGITRSFHPLEQVRFTWHAAEDTPATIVDLHMSEDEGGAKVEIIHDRLPADADVEAFKARWEQVLDTIAEAV